MQAPSPCRLAQRREGVAIVIVLAFIVLLTFLIVAFFSRATLHRQVGNNGSARARAEILGRTAADLVVADLKTEIKAASTVKGSAPYEIYVPKTAQDMVPTRVLIDTTAATNASYANLVKQSGGSKVGSGSVGGLLIASSVDTKAASTDGRTIGGVRWSSPFLLGDSTGTVNFTDTQVPKWIFYTRAGLPGSQTWNTSFKNAATSNDQMVIGRFAYNVYDEGGLLDVNVAGYPSAIGSLGNTSANKKGALAWAQLDQIPGVNSTANSDTFVKKWRNVALVSPPAVGAGAPDIVNYLAYLGISSSGSGVYYGYGPKNGFLKLFATGTSDNRLLGRQDLIRLANNGTLGITSPTPGTPSPALPFLTHYTRELNSPSWYPTSNAPGGSYHYKDNADNATSVNRNILNVKIPSDSTITSYHDDGTSFTYSLKNGDSLIQHRFSLARLSWLGMSGPQNGGTDANIATCFGLQWIPASKVWSYIAQDGSKNIKTLDQVAAEKREPNFFELLQAGILSGSVGRDAQESPEFTTSTAGSAYYQDKSTLQIFNIGASIIDQADADSYPTVIRFSTSVGTWEAVGIERLPYITQYMPIFGGSPNPPKGMINPAAGYMLVNLWDPHQKMAFSGGARPNVRVVIQGKGTRDFKNNAPEMFSIASPGIPLQLSSTARDSGFVDGKVIAASDASTSLTGGANSILGWATVPTLNYAGLRMPDFSHDFAKSAVSMVYSWPSAPGNGFQISMEYYNGSSWQPYNYMHGINDLQSWQGYRQYNTWMLGPSPVYSWDTVNSDRKTAKADPRSIRFCGGQYDWVSPGGNFRTSLWNDTSASGQQGQQKFPSSINGGRYFAPLARNNSINYVDKDGVTRLADSGLFTGNGSAGNPYRNASDRPIILDRPFQNTAELGYAFRDQPFKTLDLFSSKSADGALLDLFSTREIPTTVRAGVVNINTRNPTVLKAIFAGTVRSAAASPDTFVTTANADTISQAMVAQTSATPFQNIAELPGFVFNESTLGSLKYEREAIARALGDVGQARTWNLLIDVVAQTGRFGAAASRLNDFIVEGERRYWLHVALDRFTGKVIDQQLEPVTE